MPKSSKSPSINPADMFDRLVFFVLVILLLLCVGIFIRNSMSKSSNLNEEANLSKEEVEQVIKEQAAEHN